MKKQLREGDLFYNLQGTLTLFVVGEYPVRSDGMLQGWFLHRHYDGRWTIDRGRVSLFEYRDVESPGDAWHRHLSENR